MDVKIISTIRIKNQKAWLNGQQLALNLEQDSLLKAIYKYLGIKYPKFYKMDELSKLGFVAHELLLSDQYTFELIEDMPKAQIGMILQNSDSTIDVDSRFYDSILDADKHFPSPALFVYTLPNIALGEIAIRNKYQGENALFIFENYNANFGVNYINSLLENKRLTACFGGWFNAKAGDYDALLYLVKQSDDKAEKHIKETIELKYRNNG